MTAAELITALQKLPGDLPVAYIDSSYGHTDVNSAEIVNSPHLGSYVWIQE